LYPYVDVGPALQRFFSVRVFFLPGVPDPSPLAFFRGGGVLFWVRCRLYSLRRPSFFCFLSVSRPFFFSCPLIPGNSSPTFKYQVSFSEGVALFPHSICGILFFSPPYLFPYPQPYQVPHAFLGGSFWSFKDFRPGQCPFFPPPHG